MVEVEVDYEHEEYKKLLQANELPRGIDSFFTFHLTNVGDTEFNGKLKTIIASYGGSGFGNVLTASHTPNHQIFLGVKEKYTTPRARFDTYVEGLMVVSVEITADDNSPVEYLQGIDSTPLPGWLKPFFIVNREQLEMLLVLKKLESKLTK